MINPNEIKRLVQNTYGEIANQPKNDPQSSCCGATGCCSDESYHIFSEDYSNQNGYMADADLGLGCGIPTQFADIRKGDHVLDLGSGAGNDCFVARQLTGIEGFVTGIDFTPAMLEKARLNQEKLGFSNMEFIEGDIEAMPIPNGEIDVVISNCVLNLVPDKAKAFQEMHRVLRSGGHFCISDVVLSGELPYALKQAATMYAGCVAGAIDKNHYLRLLKKQGFIGIELVKEKEIVIPTEILLQHMDLEAIDQFIASESGVFSITVRGYKPVHIKPVISVAQEDDKEGIEQILTENRLPLPDRETINPIFFVIRFKGQPVACIGLEEYGTIGVLRSMATLPAYRSQKLANMLHDHLLRDCKLSDINTLYLRTESAEKWFSARGWKTVELNKVPQMIQESPEWQKQCSESAKTMMLDITQQ